jgi:hypothetical protein
MSGAARQREYQKRFKAGRIMVEVEVDELELVDGLRKADYLQSADPSRAEIARALENWISEELKCDHLPK